MLIALSVKNKLGFIDGSIPKPASSDLLLLNSWIRNNNVVISSILNSISKDISVGIIFSESATDIWLDPKDRFQQSNGPRIFQLRCDMVNLTQDQDSVSVYFTKLKALWEELSNYRPICSCGKCTCGGVKALHDHYQMEYIMSFLMGLNDSYSQVCGKLLLMDPLPPLNKFFSLVSQEERQRTIGSQFSSNGDTTNNMAFVVHNESTRTSNASSSRSQSTGVSNRSGVPSGGSQSVGPNRNPSRGGRPFCTHCNYPGHTVDKCYKLHGYPPVYKHKSKFPPSTPPNSTMVNQISSGDDLSGHSSPASTNVLQSLNTT